jgi:D-alanyl-D-alanine carboxypeptidase/D-alanyl-D-alanine-endopeptidase (penicillin-binding protein 4)
MNRARFLVVVRVLAVLVLAGGAAAGGYAVTRSARKEPRPSTPAPPAAYRRLTAAPPALAAGRAAPVPSSAAVSAALAPLLRAAALGRVRGEVLDVRSGRVLFARTATSTAPPASTAKLLTAAAVLAVRRVTDRISTTVVAGAHGAVVLVGAGDPTLSGAKAGAATAYPDAARLSDIAAQLRRAGIRPTRIVVDDGLFTGPAVNPAWAAVDVPSSYASAITAVLADGGRAAPDDAERSAEPDLAAGHELAAALGRPGLPVSRGHAATGARVLARVASAPYGELVEQMLQQSDNVIAECLARQVALARRQPASFSGAVLAIRAVLRTVGIDAGTGMVDGSGLAARDRLSPATLTAVVRLAATRPGERFLLDALPVAGWSGTLADRYLRGAVRTGAGVVRAKTGTLTGVATLAGTVHARSGRLLAFAFMSQSAAPTPSAEAALDRLTAALARL